MVRQDRRKHWRILKLSPYYIFGSKRESIMSTQEKDDFDPIESEDVTHLPQRDTNLALFEIKDRLDIILWWIRIGIIMIAAAITKSILFG